MHRFGLHDWVRRPRRRFFPKIRRRRREGRRLWLENLEPRQLLVGEIEFMTELTSLDLTGGPFPMPLASDPTNALGDSIDGFGFVNSQVSITLSSQRATNPGPASLGQAFAFPFGIGAADGLQTQNIGAMEPINPEELDGQPFIVDSFFDVFFDITITDVDPRPGRNFATGTPTISILDVGPANMQSFAGQREPLLFDKDAPNFGLVPPPEADPYIGHFDIVIDLSAVFGQTVDINQNGDPDLLKFTLATHSAGDENRQFIQLPDGTILDEFDSAAFLDGAILDSMDDPPFQIGRIDPQTGLPDPTAFGGPTTASSTLLNPIIEQDDFEYGLAEIELIHPDQSTETVKLAGSNTVLVTFEDAEGDAHDDDGNNLDEVDTEMVALSLRGNSSLGPLEVRLNPAIPTLGQIEELVDNNTGRLDIDPFEPGDANSFFDVFLEIEVGGQVFHTEAPKRMSAVITEKPPASGDVYESPDTIDLLDAAGNPTGFAIGASRHEPNPPIEVDVFPTSLAQLVLDVGGNQHNATLTGPTTVHVNIPPDGAAVDTDGNGLDQVPAEIVELNLTGISDFGPISVTLNPNRRTLGEIEETANNTPNVLDIQPFAGAGAADSFFDVFLEVRVGDQVLHNLTPVRMASTITHKPPAMGDVYLGIGGPVVLFDEMNNLTNFVLVQEIHIPDPGEVDRFENTVAEVVLEHPDQTTERITLVGPTIVVVDIPPDGSADDSNGNNRDDVDTELVDMFLRGNSSFGPVIVRQSRDLRTFGVIEETVDNNTGLLDVDPFAPGTADSFFDVFFDFEIPSMGVSLHNEDPAVLQATITNKPPNPGDRYVFNTPVALLDQAGNPTGFRILQEIHHPNPPIEVDEFPLGVGDILLGLPDGSTEQISLVGTATANVFFDGAVEGDALDDDGNGLDEVPTQLVDLNLQGSSSLGPVTVRLNNGVPTLGRIEEQVNNTPGVLDLDPFAPGNADSFFDVFFEIEVAGQTIFNLDPARIEATITEKPPGPGDTYRNPISAPPLELFRFDEGLGQLVSAGFLLRERHTPVTTVEMDPFFDTVGQILIEVGPQQGITTPDPNLPPSHGDYRTAADVHATYDGGALLVELQKIEHRAFADTAIRTPAGPDEIESFDSSLRGIAIIDGDVFPVELTGPVQVVSFGKVGNTTGTFVTEIISMDLTGVIPGGPVIVIRESPGQASQGQTTITDVGGGQFQVDSFFDVFTEVSIDGGPFIPSSGSTRVDLVESGLMQSTTDLPPNDGVYRTAAEIHAEFSGPDLEIVLQDVAHQRFANVQRTQNPSDPPNSERETFDSTLTGSATITSLDFSGTVPFTLTGQVETVVQDKAVRDTGTFQTEILSMDLSGTIPGGPTIMLRESPTQQSSGTTRITDLGGTFNVDSFFDVWTEISIDGGQTWIPSNGPTPVELSPPREHVVVIGDSQANVYFEGRAEGDALDDNFNGLDEVETELVQLDLTGNSSLGPVQVRLHPGTRSVGRIEELVNNNPGLLDVDPFAPGNADSFFDVFVEIEVGGQVLHTPVATRLQTVIDDKPPQDGERYIFNPPRPLELLDAAGNPTGIFIVREIHDPVTEIEEDEFELSVVEFELVYPDSSTETVQLTGPAKVNVHFEGAAQGDASDDNGNGLDEVATEMVQLDLTGTSSLGPVAVRLDPNRRSIGQIEELVNNTPGLLDVDPFAPGDADSFFDVFFEIEIGGQVFRGATAKRMQTIITNKPPGADEIYVGVDVIDLLDENGLPTGFAIGPVRHAPTALDYGDAPDAAGGPATGNPYPTLLEHDGARHVIVTDGPFLGVVPPDPEIDGQPNATASGDNVDGNDDEDGLTAAGDFSGPDQVQPGESFSADVTVNGTGLLNAWADWNRNGSWNDPGEQLAADVPFATGPGGATITLNGAAPTNAVAGDSFIRVRVSSDMGLLPTGLAGDGEVEDHPLTILSGTGCSLVVTHTGDSGNSSLRDAIVCANTNPGLDTIRFNIDGPGTHIIMPPSPLPAVTDAAVIDGTTEPDYAGIPVVELNGNSAGFGANGLLILAGPSTVRGLAINRFLGGAGIQVGRSDGHTIESNYIGTDTTSTARVGNQIGIRVSKSSNNMIGTSGAGNVISGNTADGVRIVGTASTGNQVRGNLIGPDVSGTIRVGNSSGVAIVAGQNNTVGGRSAGQGNIISANALGVELRGDNNLVEGNRIGTNMAGDGPLLNFNGVFVTVSTGNVIGGTASGAGNQISGNSDSGVVMAGARATGNFVEGNLIGTNADGTAAVGNRNGVSLIDAPGNLIGGTAPGTGNTISGNSAHGVLIEDAGATGNRVEGNQVGTNLAGDGPVGNLHGFTIDGAASNVIGGTTSGAGNVISGNRFHGVRLLNSGATGNLVQGNIIGTDATGTTAIPNTDGVFFAKDAADNTIGGTAPGAANEIAWNNGRGVFVTLKAGTGNAVTQNSIHNNGGLGIDLAGRGRTANDPGDLDAGGNNQQNFPVLEIVLLNAGNLDIAYMVDSTTANSAYPLTVEFFIADSDSEEGETFLGDAQYTAAVAGGTAIASIPAGSATVGSIIVATATDDDGNTSEFSAPATVAAMLQAAGGPADGGSAPSLTHAALGPIVDAAIGRLADLGLNANLLSSIDVSIADLPGAALGAATANSVTIDVNAAGHGWFVDPTPLDDSEFSNPHSAIRDPQSIDLLTAVMHELGHTVGLDDIDDVGSEDDLMFGLLSQGVRKTALEASLADEVFAGGEMN